MRYVEGVELGRPVSVVGLGTWQFGSAEWGYGEGYDRGEADRIVARALELGITLVDSAADLVLADDEVAALTAAALSFRPVGGLGAARQVVGGLVRR